jgi:diguanylate cyclase (GGDEF)-like protein/PAS domain S-box-containing protein
LVVASAGLLLGAFYGTIFAGLSFLVILGLFFGCLTVPQLQALGWPLSGLSSILPDPPAIQSTLAPQLSLLYHAFNLSLATLFIFVATNDIRSALRRAQEHQRLLTSKNRELREIRNTLQQRIADRTAEILNQKQFFEALVKNNPIAVVTLDLEQRIVSCNRAFEKLFGYAQDEVLGQNLDDLITTPEIRPEALGYTQQVGRGENLYATGVRRRKDGALIDVEIFGVPVIVENQQIGVLGMYNDITERKRAEEYLHFLATHDPLTNLPNRSLFYDRLNHALYLAQRNHQSIAVLFLDLDGFKTVNDVFGHEHGDQLLQVVADRLKSGLRESDTVARLGGDEFSFVFEGIEDRDQAGIIAGRLLHSLAIPINLNGQVSTITGSIGISISPHNGLDAESLLKHADAAMYQAKLSGKNTYQFYDANASNC